MNHLKRVGRLEGFKGTRIYYLEPQNIEQGLRLVEPTLRPVSLRAGSGLGETNAYRR